MFFETSEPNLTENREKKTITSRKTWTLSLKYMGIFNIVKTSPVLGVAAAQDKPLENVSISKFVRQ